MAIEQSSDGSITVTGEHVQVFQLLRVAHALALEVNTGMKMSARGSVMQVAAHYCGSAKRTKRAVLRDYVAFMREVMPPTADGAWEPSPSIAKALA